jgi:SPP1 family phage portal protein
LFYIDKDKQLGEKEILAYINVFKAKYSPKLIKNKKYYDVLNPAIMSKTVEDTTKSCEKVPIAFSRYITTLISGYFMGKPVSYSIPDDNLSTIISLNRNKEISHNTSLEKDASIYGIAYELLYLDGNKNLKFTKLNPETVIPIYSNEIDGELLYVIRFWDETDILTNNDTINVEVYSNEDIKFFKHSSGGLELTEIKEHYFKTCPIIPIFNNEDRTGDSECVQKLIDCYDKSISSSQDFFNELNDSYLVIYNSDLDDETIKKMKSNRIFAVDSADTGGNAKIEWLTRDGKNSENESFNNRIVDDILTFSFVKDLQQATKSHISVESTKMGLMGVEQLCVEKETFFRTALLKRLEIICNVYNLFGNNFDFTDVKITFVRNIPQNISAISDTVSKLKDTVSTKTLLSQIPFVQSVDDELKQLEEERKNNYDNEIKTETIVQ